jgi:hypothetical protein
MTTHGQRRNAEALRQRPATVILVLWWVRVLFISVAEARGSISETFMLWMLPL